MAKSLNIKNQEAATLAAELTALTGKGTTELILELLRREAGEHQKSMGVNRQRRRIDAILRRARKKLPKTAHANRRITDYDKHGLPKYSSIHLRYLTYSALNRKKNHFD